MTIAFGGSNYEDVADFVEQLIASNGCESREELLEELAARGVAKDVAQAIYDHQAGLREQQGELLTKLETHSRTPLRSEKRKSDVAAARFDEASRFIDELLTEAERQQADREFLETARKRFNTALFGGTMQTETDNELSDWLRHGGRPYFDVNISNLERHDLTKGASPGTELVPQGFGRFFVAFVAQSGVLQTNVSVLNTTSGETVIVPKETAFGTANLIAEGASITEADATIAQVSLSSYKYAALMQASREVIEDSAVDVLGLVASSLGKSIGTAVATAYTTGTGSSQPQGIANAPTAGVTLATGQTTTITSADSLIDLYFSVSEPYRRNGFWLMNDTTMAIVRKLKASGSGDYVLDLGQLGDPLPRILGRPVLIESNMASPAANAYTIAFGDFSEYFLVRNAGTVRIERSDDFAFQNDLVTFRGILRTDSKQVINGASGAVKFLRQSAT
jgi:HK97 family phage major capsid protein